MSRRRNSLLSSKEKFAEFKEIFSLVDKDGGGSISSNELDELLQIVGIEATPDELEAMVKQIDVDDSGEIDFEEFAAVMTKRVNPNFSSAQIKEAFQTMQDINAGTGTNDKLHIETIVKHLTLHGSETMTDERARELVMQMEVDHDGYVNFEEYVDMIMNW